MTKEELQAIFNKNKTNQAKAMLTASNAHIIVDKSYVLYLSMFNAHTYIKKEYALEDDPNLDLTTIGDFTEAFKKKFKSTIFYTAKNALNGGLPKMSNVIFANDCPKREIWRKSIFDGYKLQRILADKTKNPFDFGKVFAYADEHLIPEFIEENQGSKIISVDSAEGDDIIASLIKLIPEDETKVVIANDKDYIQLLDAPNLILTNCQGRIFSLEEESGHKLLVENNKKLTAKEFLLKKILIGDKADNIDSIFPRCGEASAIKLILNKDLLKEKLADPEIRARFELNKKLIDFSNIPDYIIKSVKDQL